MKRPILLVSANDKTLEQSDGTVLFFSVDRFKNVICSGSACFLCGAAAGSKEFNDEHIFPRWLLKDLGMFDVSITLPNQTKVRYGQYTLPCCKACNSRLGAELEEPVSALLRGGFQAVRAHIERQGTELLYAWLSFIYLKTHLKDHMLRHARDLREPGDSIAKAFDYDWGLLHHAYCVARAFFFDIELDDYATGSFIVFPLKEREGFPRYDYRDFMLAQTALLRFRDVALLAVFDDAGGSFEQCQRLLSKITGHLSHIQLREVLAHMAYTNLALSERPRFATNVTARGIAIRTQRPKVFHTEPFNAEELGRIMYACVEEYIPDIIAPNHNEIREAIKSARYTFLFDAEGSFIADSMIPYSSQPQSST